jgi:putative phosphoserine phosphatase/1-acylglycerol-3-phosphate O-acyltransferase
MTRFDLVTAVYLSIAFKLRLKDQLKIIDDMVTWVKGMSEKTIIDLCSEVYHDILLPSVYAEARTEIEIHKSKKARLVILSSALAPICQEVAKDLGMDDILCSRLEVKNGYLTGHPLGHLCFGEEKRTRLKEYCEKNNTNTADAWYYGDSISDLPALSSVGNPVCVNPDRQLKKTAYRRGWKILRWN